MNHSHQNTDRFKFKTWIIPLPDFHFVHQTYDEDNDHRNFFGREKEVQDLVNVLRNNNSHSGSYLVTGYRGAGKTSFVQKVMGILSKGHPDAESYDNVCSKAYLKLENFAIYYFPKPYQWILQRKIPESIIISFILFYLLFLPFGWWDWLILPLFALWYYFKKYYLAVFSPRQWCRWAFKPVVQVPVNLSHDIRDSKKVIFGIISLLREKYLESLRFTLPKIIVPLSIIAFSAILAMVVYRSSPDFHHYLEAKTHTLVFGTAYPDKNNYCSPQISEKVVLPHLSSPDHRLLKGKIDGKPIDLAIEQTSPAKSGYVSFFREFIFVPVYCAIYHFSQDVYYFARPPFPDNHLFQFHGDERLAFALRSLDELVIFFDFQENRTNEIRELENQSHEKESQEEKVKKKDEIQEVGQEIIQYFEAFNHDFELFFQPIRTASPTTENNVAKNQELKQIIAKYQDYQVMVSLFEKIKNQFDYIRNRKDYNQNDYQQLAFLLKEMREKYSESFLLLLEYIAAHGSNNSKVNDLKVVAFLDQLETLIALTKTKESKIKELAPRPYHIVFFLLIYLILHALVFWLNPRQKIIRRLNDIDRRIQASDILDASALPGSKFPFWRKRYQHFHRLDERQAENLLLQVLTENAKSHFIHTHIVFVFDELDKIHPPQEDIGTGKTVPVELGLSESVRKRQYEIEQLLGNLKNLITTAPCNFIFAAGREMMDANLADRGEIRFLHGTLFDRVYYIPSFLTDPADGNRYDITSMIEQYVCRRLMSPVCAKHHYFQRKVNDFNEIPNDYHYWSLKTYMQYLKAEKYDEHHCSRLITFLQDFIYFLSYRSGGNTQKLSLQFEEFLRPIPNHYFSQSGEKRYYRLFAPKRNTLVLYFNQQAQYRVQLIAHMFTIFHGSYSKLVSRYGDKLSISVFSILDYVFKFHSMSFARRDLERMPGALDIHRAPALPQIIDVLIEKILLPYTIPMNNGLYNFHFARYIQREIIYISQFSEQDMAAFNFSLDESIQIKQHYRQILEEQIKLYQDKSPIEQQIEKGIQGTQGIFVLPNLHMVLGDLHAQDNEFDQAMDEYLNAASHLKFVENGIRKALLSTKSKTRNSQKGCQEPLEVFRISLVLYVRIMLRLGLLQERRMIYDSATAAYSQIIDTIDNLISFERSSKHQKLEQGNFFSDNIERLNLFIQPYLCLAFLHAKRDYSLDAANHFMERALKLIKDTGGNQDDSSDQNQGKDQNNSCIEQLCSVASQHHPKNCTSAKRTGLISKLHIRWAQMWMMRSKFDKAICQYLCALQSLFDCCQRQRENNTLTYSELGEILAGLGNACTALALHTLYGKNADNNKVFHCPPKSIEVGGEQTNDVLLLSFLPTVDDATVDNADYPSCFENMDKITKCFYIGYPKNEEELKQHLYCEIRYILTWWWEKLSNNSENSLDKEKLQPLFSRALPIYVLASYAYRLAGVPLEEGRMLWKMAYAVSYGLSYLDILRIQPNFIEDPDKKEKIDWLFLHLDDDQTKTSFYETEFKNPIRSVFSKGSEGSYSVHRSRLQKEIGVNKDHLLRWISPPLTQILLVLGHFWHAYWEDVDEKGDWYQMDENAFEVIDMGAFPMIARILALYLKGRWYQKAAQKQDESQARAYKATAFQLLVQALEDCQAYEGGFDFIALPLGIIHYHIWEIARENEDENSKILEQIKTEDQFKGDMQRYFSPNYCYHRTEKLLTELLSRHSVPGINKERYFIYMSKHYYLYDAFSDPFVNGMWAVEYGFVPVAQFMIQHMREQTEKALL
jgi:hypothetical protein